MKKTIIIGGGILGSSTAYHLTKMGKDVTIIDREDPGQATTAAAGIICPWLSQRRNRDWYALVKAGAAYYPELMNELKKDGETYTGYKRVGALRLHEDEGKLIAMEKRVLAKREEAPEIGEVSRLDSEEINRLFPLLAKSYIGLFVSGAARVEGQALQRALLRGAIKHGARFLRGDAALISEGNCVLGVSVNGEVLHADETIATVGAWAPPLLKPLGIEIKIREQKAQIMHLRTQEKNTGNWPVVMPPGNQYILAFDRGRIIVGATHEDDMHFDRRVTGGAMHDILKKALHTAPGLTGAEWLETRVGFRPHTPDFSPVFGRIPGVPGLWFANGLGASGLTCGPYLGAVLAKMITGHSPDLNVQNYTVSKAL